MHIEQVDERDSSWEDDGPRFRVYLHGGTRHDFGDPDFSWTDTYDVTGADILQVVDWAQRQAGEELIYAVALVRDDAAHERRNPGHGRGLVWLVGQDGFDSSEDDAARVTYQRMLDRRRHPVGIPAADRAPTDAPGRET